MTQIEESEETALCEQLMEKVQEIVDQYRQDNNDWDDDSELVAITYISHAYVLKQGWTVRQFIKYLRVSERVVKKMSS
jgi:hypothetical protein